MVIIKYIMYERDKIYSLTRHEKVRFLTTAAFFTAIISIISPFSISLGSVPVSLATFAVFLSASVGGARCGAASVLCYLMLGVLGVPVFAGFSSGLERIVSPTGGYLVGYIPATAVIGVLANIKTRHHVGLSLFGMILGNLAVYTVGTLWFSLFSGTSVSECVAVCVLPFVFGDILKTALAYSLSEIIKRRILRCEKTTKK